MSSGSTLRIAAIALVALPCAVAVTYLARTWATHGSAEASMGMDAGAAAPQEPLADWCAPGFEAIPDGCLAYPDGGAPKGLIVYLHGRYARDVVDDEVDRQRRLAGRATKGGYAVLATRSRLGVCSASELADWYCWPTSEAAADPDAVRRWATLVDAVALRVGAPRRYLLGFSSGGYFAALTASRGWAPFDAVVVAHGGPVGAIEPAQASRVTPPMLLLSADDDIAQIDMMHLDDDLRRASWPHDAYARAGAHGLADADIDAALAFFARSHEGMPLRPALSLHRPVLHVRDAATESSVAGDDASEPDDAGDPFAPRTPGPETNEAGAPATTIAVQGDD